MAELASPPNDTALVKRAGLPHRHLTIGGAVAVIALALGLTTTPGPAGAVTAPDATNCPWLTSRASPSARAAMVVGRMNLGQLDDLVHRVSGPYEGSTTAIPSLCVPALGITDGPNGAAGGLTGVTQLPAAVSAAATWDPSTVRAYGAVTGSEIADKGADVDLGPAVDIVRDPRWGRAFEEYGEDPYLTGQLGAADVEGVQSQGVIAMVKHLALYNQETFRNTPRDDVIVSDRVAHEIYFSPFETAIEQGGARAVMCSYATIDGVDACQDPYLADLLYDQWHFDGFVESDGLATHSTAGAANVGLEDVESPGPVYFGRALETDVQHGVVPLGTVREMATRVLTTMFAAGLFNRAPTGSPSDVVTSPQHVAVARVVADEGTVLLKNADASLPIPSTSSIAVIGDDAGPDAITAGTGTGHVIASSVVTPYQGISAAAAAGAAVTYSQGNSPTQPDDDPALEAQAVAAARSASVAVVFAGITEGEGADLPDINLSPAENGLITAVAQANPDTVVVLDTGSAVTMPWLSSVRAVLEAWYPGQEDGDSIADILFGKVDPSGKLPVTFPVKIADVPASTPAQWPGVRGTVDYSEGLLVGYRWYEAKRIIPLFPFGFGLSYTTFSFSNLRLTPSSIPPDGTTTVRVDVTNTGKVAGADTVQVYVGDPAATGEPPEQLEGFRKVTIAPGQSVAVAIPLGPRSFSIWDSPDQAWEVTPGRYRVMVGDSSAHLPLATAISLG